MTPSRLETMCIVTLDVSVVIDASPWDYANTWPDNVSPVFRRDLSVDVPDDLAAAEGTELGK